MRWKRVNSYCNRLGIIKDHSRNCFVSSWYQSFDFICLLLEKCLVAFDWKFGAFFFWYYIIKTVSFYHLKCVCVVGGEGDPSLYSFLIFIYFRNPSLARLIHRRFFLKWLPTSLWRITFPHPHHYCWPTQPLRMMVQIRSHLLLILIWFA